MEQRYECLIVGAGMAGAIAARELAQRGGMEYDCGPGVGAFFSMYCF